MEVERRRFYLHKLLTERNKIQDLLKEGAVAAPGNKGTKRKRKRKKFQLEKFLLIGVQRHIIAVLRKEHSD